MPTITQDCTEPVSSGEIEITDPERALDVETKHRAIAEFLQLHKYDALLLQKPANFAWFTSGGDCSRSGNPDSTAALFITDEARVAVCSNVDSPQIFDKEIAGLGFQLKERSWQEPRHLLIEDLCRGRTIASDSGFRGTHDVAAYLTGFRIPLAEIECERMRVLGRLVAHAVEATARHFTQGQTEAEIAGEVAHRLIKRQVIPERIQVLADGQGRRYRDWSFGTDPVQRYCVISVLGRRWGLCAAASRTASFGEPPEDVKSAHQRALLIQATGIHFSQPEWELFEVWSRVKRIYEKLDCRDEWLHADQAEIIGFNPTEVPVVPKSEFRLSPKMAVHWHPSVGPAVVGDTILVGESGNELLTPMQNWPQLTVRVKKASIPRPDILRREA